MATLVKNKSAGLVTLPQVYGGSGVPAGKSVVIADTVDGVIAAFGGLSSTFGLEFTTVPDGQAAIAKATGGGAADTTYIPGIGGNWSPPPSDVATGLDQLASRATTDEANISALATRATADEVSIGQLQVATRFTYAVARTTVIHMEADLEGLTGLTPPGPSALLATAVAFVAALQTPWANHIGGVGTPTVNGEHLAADSTNPFTATPATLPDLITWIGAAKTAIIGHGAQAGVHFHDDTTSTGTGFTITVDPPVTQADCNQDLTDIWNAMKGHFNHGTAVLPWAD